MDMLKICPFYIIQKKSGKLSRQPHSAFFIRLLKNGFWIILKDLLTDSGASSGTSLINLYGKQIKTIAKGVTNISRNIPQKTGVFPGPETLLVSYVRRFVPPILKQFT